MKKFIRGIKNLWKWFPIIWKDRDYDHYYVEVILHQKLSNMYNFFVSEKSYSNWNSEQLSQALKSLRICIVVLERKITHFYWYIDCKNPENSKRISDIEQRDEQLFAKLFGKYSCWWWD